MRRLLYGIFFLIATGCAVSINQVSAKNFAQAFADFRKAQEIAIAVKDSGPGTSAKFNADYIAELLDKRDSQRSHAVVPTLSQAEIAALIKHIKSLWKIPGGAFANDPVITIRITLNRDGLLSEGPKILTEGEGAAFNSLKDSAIKAVFAAQPFNMLRSENYDAWKDIEISFDPKDTSKSSGDSNLKTPKSDGKIPPSK